MFLLLFIITSPFWGVYFFSKLVFNVLYYYVYNRYKYKLFKFIIKLNLAYRDNDFMTNLSMGVFASSLVALFVANTLVSTIICSFASLVSFIAMVDYRYKK